MNIARQTPIRKLDDVTAQGINREMDNLVNSMNAHDAGLSRWNNVDTTALKLAGNTAIPIFQVVTASSTTSFSTTSSTFQTTNLTADITPLRTTSKILVLASGMLNSGTGGVSAYLTITRSGTNIFGTNGQFELVVTGSAAQCPATLIALDSPASTSALTYAVKLKNSNNVNSVQFGNTNETQTIVLIEIGI